MQAKSCPWHFNRGFSVVESWWHTNGGYSKKQGAPSAEKKMAEVFGNVEIVTKDKGYYILRSVKESKEPPL